MIHRLKRLILLQPPTCHEEHRHPHRRWTWGQGATYLACRIPLTSYYGQKGCKLLCLEDSLTLCIGATGERMTTSEGESQELAYPDPLPSFRQPPVVEVVLAVSFETIPGFDNLQILRFWESQLQANFPKVEQQARYEPPVERFGQRPRMPQVKLELREELPTPRYWFINEADTQVIQLQNDWFARNWRKRERDPEYHRYGSIREPFAENFRQLASFVEDQGLGSIKPIQCEISYINQITPDEAWRDHGDLSRVVNVWQDADGFLPKPEQVQFLASYVIPGEEGPLGRLHVSMQPAFTIAEEQPIYVLNMTARGYPLGDNLDGVLRFFDIGHEWIVRGFASITSDVMHRLWGRDDS